MPTYQGKILSYLRFRLLLTVLQSVGHTESPGSFQEKGHAYGPHKPPVAGEYEVDDLNIVCPSHTTERKLMTKIDFRVIPVLSLMYLLAFLDR